MEPTPSPDNARPARGLARFWPGQRDPEDGAALPDSSEPGGALSGESGMLSLGPRRVPDALGGGLPPGPFPRSPGEGPGLPAGPFSRGPVLPPASGLRAGPGLPVVPIASRGASSPGGVPPGNPSPGGVPPGNGPLSGGGAVPPSGGGLGPAVPQAAEREADDRDPDHPGAPENGEDTAEAVESSRTDPWDRGGGTFGGFGLGGRNGRFLFGGRGQPEPRAGLNGHAAPEPAPSAVDEPAADEAGRAAPSDEDGGDMNGRTGSSDYPAAFPTGADAGEPPRRQATGWASVPTSAVPVISPTSGSPTSGVPVSGTPISGSPVSDPPVSGGPVSGSPVSGSPLSGSPVSVAPVPLGLAPGSGGTGYGPPPGYPPGRQPDPAPAPVSGAPAPRAPAGRSAVESVAPAGDRAGPDGRSPSDGYPPADARMPDDAPGRVDIGFGPGLDEDTPPRPPAPRRSASLEDAAPARRGRRAAPETAREDAPLRPGDVAAGQISFWDDDATRHFRAAWHEVKAEFVDDPVTALTRAHDLLTDAVNELTEAMLAERDELDPLRGTATPDTESMRMAMRGYREFLERILAL